MTWRSTLGIVATILVLSGCFLVGRHNAELLSQQLEIWRDASGRAVGLSVGQALLACLALGATLVAAGWAVRSTRQAARRAEERRTERRRRALAQRLQAGLAAAAAGRDSEALAELEQVLEQEAEHATALAAAADVLRRLGRPADAAELRQRLLAVEPGSPKALSALAEDQRARGDVELAAATLEKLLAAGPEKPAAVARRLLELRLEQGDASAALAAHETWAKRQSAVPAEEVALERAALETRQAAREAREGRVKEAVAALKKLLRKHPGHAPTALALAQAQLLAGDEQAAIETWVEAYERTREGAFLVAAEEHFLGHLPEEEDAVERASQALAVMKRFTTCSGDRPQAVAFLGKIQTRFEMLEDAAATLDSVRESFPDNPTFTYYAARIAEKRGRHDVAAEWYRGILKALDILSPGYRCRRCEAQAPEFRDRCPSCGRWGTVALDIGIQPLSQPLPAAHPVYAVRGEEEPAEAGSDAEQQGA